MFALVQVNSPGSEVPGPPLQPTVRQPGPGGGDGFTEATSNWGLAGGVCAPKFVQIKAIAVHTTYRIVNLLTPLAKQHYRNIVGIAGVLRCTVYLAPDIATDIYRYQAASSGRSDVALRLKVSFATPEKAFPRRVPNRQVLKNETRRAFTNAVQEPGEAWHSARQDLRVRMIR